MPITIASIQTAINNDIDRVNKSKSKRGIKSLTKIKEDFTKFTDKHRATMKKNNKITINNLKKLLTKITNATTQSKKDNTVDIGKSYGYTVNFSNIDTVIRRIKDDIQLLNVINVHALLVEINDLPKKVGEFMVKYTQRVEKERENAPVQESIISIMKRTRERDNKAEIVKLDIIEPLPLFIMLGFVSDPDFKEKLQTELALDDNLLPQDYTMFENFNKIVVEDRGIQSGANKIMIKNVKTGKYNTVEVRPSEISKKFKKIEEDLQNNIDISKFSKIPKTLMDKYNSKIHEINSVFRIAQDFGSKKTNYTPVFIGMFVNTFHELMNEIKDKQGKKAFAQYILRSLDLLEIRRKIYSASLEKMVSNNGIISQELANSLQSNDNDQQLEVNPDNVHEDSPEISGQSEHYNERFNDDFGTDNQFFDDAELTSAFDQ